MIPPELKKAFDETYYVVHRQPPFTLRIGQHSPDLDALLKSMACEGAAFITAWNPMCQPLSDEENQQRQLALTEELKALGLEVFPGTGQHPDNGWPGEASLLVMGLKLQAARQLSRKYGQMAFVWQALHGPARLER